MKILKRIGIIVGVLIIIFISAGIIISVTYEDTAIKYLKKYLDKHLITEIEVDKINFSLFKNFPNASVELKNIMARSTLNFTASDFGERDTETLLVAENIFFEFKLIKILSGIYILRNIHINNGKLTALIDKAGNCNYNIWIPGDNKPGSSFEIDLQSLTFTDLEFNILNLKDNYSLTAFSNKTSLNGNLSNSLSTLFLRGSINLHSFNLNDKNIIQNKEIFIESDLLYQKDYYKIGKGKLKSENIVFNISGDYKKDVPPKINLIISSHKTQLSKLSLLFPNYLKSLKKEFSLYGKTNFRAVISGNMSANYNPHISTEFDVSNGAIVNKRTKEKLSGITLIGKYSNGKDNNDITSSIKINNFNSSTKNSKLYGNFYIRNFNSPFIELKLNGDIFLEELQKFINIDTLEYINGTINTEMEFQGTLSGISKITKEDFLGLNKKCTINITDANFGLAGSKFDFENINGEILIKEDVKFKNVSFLIKENDFLVNGTFNNVFEFIFLENNYLTFDADINSTSVNLETLLFDQSENTSRNRNSGKLSSKKIFFNFNLSIENFAYKKFHATNISSTINYQPGLITLKSFSFNSFNGVSKGNGAILRQPDNFIIQCQSQLESIDIKKLFYSFNNFGQDFILDTNLKGDLSGEISFSAMWDKGYKLVSESVNADCKINIRNGELIEFKPLIGLSNFIDVEELRHVQFKNLNNEILIKDKTIVIPEMDIYSSALNISALGIHRFDNSYDYRITVSLTDILFKKARKKRQEIDNFGIIEDDGIGKISVPLRIVGKNDKYNSSFDKQTALDDIKKNINEEKKTIKNIIQEEFSISDKKNKQNVNSPDNKQVNILWEDQNNKKDVIFESREINENNNPEFIIEWDDDEDSIINKNN